MGELERLAYLNEELHEVGQIIGKIIRHGYESRDPTKAVPVTDDNRGGTIGWRNSSPTNRHLLESEVADVKSAPGPVPTSAAGQGTDYTTEALANSELDFLDQRASEWMAETSVQRMFNAIASLHNIDPTHWMHLPPAPGSAAPQPPSVSSEIEPTRGDHD